MQRLLHAPVEGLAGLQRRAHEALQPGSDRLARLSRSAHEPANSLLAGSKYAAKRRVPEHVFEDHGWVDLSPSPR